MRRDDICLYLAPNDRSQLQALRTDRNTPRKLVWRAEIVLSTAGGWAVCSNSQAIAPMGELLGFCGFEPGHIDGCRLELGGWDRRAGR